MNSSPPQDFQSILAGISTEELVEGFMNFIGAYDDDDDDDEDYPDEYDPAAQPRLDNQGLFPGCSAETTPPGSESGSLASLPPHSGERSEDGGRGPDRDYDAHPATLAELRAALIVHRERFKHDPELANKPRLLDDDEINPIFLEFTTQQIRAVIKELRQTGG